MSPKLKKRNLGQFFTTNADQVFRGFEKFVRNKKVTDPFAGSGDLLSWAEKNGAFSARGFDVDDNLRSKNISINDSLLNPQKYQFVVTNPPYLNVNKADKITKEKYFRSKKFEDLYQISIESILESEEGIVVVPINFLSAENSRKIRNIFFDKFEIVELNLFNHQVFEDTTYNVISFYYRKKKDPRRSVNIIRATLFPGKEKISFRLEKAHNWQFGGDFLGKINQTENYLGIKRLTSEYISRGKETAILSIQNPKNKTRLKVSRETKKLLKRNIIILKAIDEKNGEKIKLDDIRNYDVEAIVGKSTSRSMAHLILDKDISIEEQEKLIKLFNERLKTTRKKYRSLFLTNFRDNGRKRISFDLSYKFLNYLYLEKRSKDLSSNG